MLFAPAMTPAKRLFLLLAALVPACAEPSVASLSWLTGCWEMSTARGHIEETWTRPAGGTLFGIGRTISNGRTVFTEFLQIAVEGETLAYTARIGTPGATRFPLARAGESELVFENLAHDFPQRIIYRKSAGGLHARVEGTVKGKLRAQDFPYQPCR
jgi:hypothetical protein